MDNAHQIVKFLVEDEEYFDISAKDLQPEGEDDPYDRWMKTYEPQQNPIDANAPYDGTMLETYGEELNYVRAVNADKPNHIWTLVDGDNNESIIVAGFHFVNRIGYYVTKYPWKDSSEHYLFGEGDPTDAKSLADKYINYETPQEWKPAWRITPLKTKIKQLQAYGENYGLEDVASEAVEIINKIAEN